MSQQPAGSNSGWLRGKVKAVLSGDTLKIMGSPAKADIPPEKTVVLAHLLAPRLAPRGGQDDPFAWDSREYLRKLCIGKDVVFRTEYTIPIFPREYCSVFVGNKYRKEGCHSWLGEGNSKAIVKEAKGMVTPEHTQLLHLEEQARQQGIGLWDRSLGAAEAAIRNLPKSAVGDPANLDAMHLLASNKGKPMEAIVEQVCDGSLLRVYMLPEFQFLQVCIAGIQAPTISTEVLTDEPNGDSKADFHRPLTSSLNGVFSHKFWGEAKLFTEIRVLNRNVHIVPEGIDNFSNMIGSVYYAADGELDKDLAMEILENGYAKYVEWSANLMEHEARMKLKAAELHAKRTKLRLWTNYVLPTTNTNVLCENFIGKVVEVVSGECIIVADDFLPFGSPAAERRVNLSSIRCPKLGNPQRQEKPAPYAREAREFLRTRLIGRQVQVSMEYSRNVPLIDMMLTGATDSKFRVMDFGSVFLSSTTPATEITALESNVAESHCSSTRKEINSAKDPPSVHVKCFLHTYEKAKDFLPKLQRNRRMNAFVEYIVNCNKYKLYVPKEKCVIDFSLSGVRRPRPDEPYWDDAISLMRQKIMERDVEVDATGSFLGSLWESKTNVGISLLKSGLARLQKFGADRIPDAHLLVQAEQFAKKLKLKIWENYVDREDVTNEEYKVVVAESLEGGTFYVQAVSDLRDNSIQHQLDSLSLTEALVLGSFNPKKGDLVLAQFHNSWNRAVVVREVFPSTKDIFAVLYIDYGNEEIVTYNKLRPMDPYVSSAPGLAQRCQLAYLEVPTFAEDYGYEAAAYLSEITPYGLNEFTAVIEQRDTSGGNVTGHVTGPTLFVTLIDQESGTSINAMMLKAGLARMEKSRQRGHKDRRHMVLEELEKYQAQTRTNRLGIWEWEYVTRQPGLNVAELIIAHGYGTVIRHSDYEERSNHYESLVAAESHAISRRKGIHSGKDPTSIHVPDLLTGSANKAKRFLLILQHNRRMTAVVEDVISGHKFKLFIPNERCNIAFSVSGVRCPGHQESYYNDAISFMRRKIMQRDVEIEVAAVDRTGTFLGSMWESKTNVGIVLLKAGFARLETGFGADRRIPDAHRFAQAERFAKRHSLKIWEHHVEREEVLNVAPLDKKHSQMKNVADVTQEAG